mgnify:CR=1 FL=1
MEVLKLIGALGFFIYGMKEMSDGLQKVAGSKMRDILRVMTSNRFLGVFTANQFTETFMSVVDPGATIMDMSDENWKWTIGLILAVITSFVIFGGLTKIAKVASAIVPFMVAVYLVAVTILASIIGLIP